MIRFECRCASGAIYFVQAATQAYAIQKCTLFCCAGDDWVIEANRAK